MYKIFFSLLIATFLQAEVYDGVAVVIQDKIITLYDIKQEMKQDKLSVKQATDLLIRQKLEAIELQKRKITVGSSEVYEDIKQLAQRNHLSVGEFYDAVRETNGLTSTQLKEKIKQKLLSQKLYNAIAMSSLSEPSEEEIKEYYELHKNDLQHPIAFNVIIYDARDKRVLQTKASNPMFYSPQIRSNEQTLPYNRISPELASLLEKTKPYHFTPVVPNGKGGFMTFYLKNVQTAKNLPLEDVRNEIINTLMAKKREAVLSDYFARLKDNTDINIIRLPKE
jgi:hypothetical protein